eukprot:1159347-Pelagomonas_calceolata.AAC.9
MHMDSTMQMVVAVVVVVVDVRMQKKGGRNGERGLWRQLQGCTLLSIMQDMCSAHRVVCQCVHRALAVCTGDTAPPSFLVGRLRRVWSKQAACSDSPKKE